MKKQLETGLAGAALAVSGFFGGQLSSSGISSPIVESKPEIVIVSLESLVGDQLKFEIFGPGRVLWGEGKMVENDGWHEIPLGQLPNANDLEFRRYAYVANAKTGKFYPSTSYPARGTAVRDRRFFQTKQAAIAAGFIPTKLVK